MPQNPRQFRPVSVWPCLDEPILWLERKALRGGAPLFHQKWSRGPATLCFGDRFLPVPSFATNHVARLQRRTQNQQPFQTPAALQTAEQRTAAQEKTSKFLDRLSSQSFSDGALCSFGIAKSPGRCRHDEIFNHDSQLPNRPSNHRRDPTPIANPLRSRKPLGIRTSPVLILP